MLDRNVAPAPHPITSIQLPPAEVSPLSNGARLHCLPGTNQPVIKLEIIFRAGKWFEPAPGISYLTAKMLLEGTQNYTAREIAEKIAFYGSSIEVTQGFDRNQITLYCLSKHLPYLVPLVVEVLNNPTFPEAELTALKNRTLQNISIEKQKSSYLATTLLTKNIYGPGHPYVAGTEEDAVRAVSRNQIITFFHQHFNLSEAEIILAGDIQSTHKDQVIAAFGAAAPVNKPLLELNHQEYPAAREDYLDLPEKLQSSIRFGGRWPRMNHPDYPKLALLNKILGGYFGSRLMRNIREEKGFTYGIFSTISPKENDTLFYIGTDVNYKNAEETIKEIKKEIRLLQEELISEAEINTVKTYTIGKFINDTANIFDQSEKYKTILVQNLPEDYYTHYLREIQNCRPEEIPPLVEKYLAPGNMYLTVAGKTDRD